MFIGPLKPRVLIIGHSFVRRILPHNLQCIFPSFWDVFTVGISGAKVQNVRDIIKDYIDLYLPDYVYIQIGGNDINGRNSCMFLFDLLECIYYIKSLGPFILFVGGIFPRSLPRNMDAETYNKCKSFVNRQLHFYLEPHGQIHFCTSRKFKISHLCNDGVHLSRAGQVKWLKEIFHCIKNH